MQSVILGTAQWGLDYGTTNAIGRLPEDTIRAITTAAEAASVTGLDTAPAYGDAEARIGRLVSDLSVQTKVSAAGRNSEQLRESLEASLVRLSRRSVAGVLIHDWATLEPCEQVRAAGALEELRAEGLAVRVGVSAYTAADLATALAAFTGLDVVQVPVSILDQRLEGSSEIAAVRSRGGVVQARSVFLQGAALATPSHALFGSHPDVIRLREAGTPLSLCLGYVATRPWVDELVLAATSRAELDELMPLLRQTPPDVVWSEFASADAYLLDPRLWTAPTREG
jgi:aryl-alcohol dehydrogenase-like predicted oxidoreductase